MPEASIEQKRLAILRLLLQANRPLSSEELTANLCASGFSISERTVRFHLLALDKEGMTEYIGRQGRRLTLRGREELARARVFEKVGFLSARIDQMTYLMDFRLAERAGTVIVNVSVIEKTRVREACPLMHRVFAAGYAMGRLLTLFAPGEQVGEMLIPEDCIGIGTTCSMTLNGILLDHKIPANSRFGGLLELVEGKPQRFVEIISYSGTTLDPLEVFIKSGMTDYLHATENGNGRIGAGFREVPAAAREKVIELAARLEEVGLGGFLEIGLPGQPLFGIPVSEGSVGIVVIGGLNPIAILEESGIRLQSRALSGLVEYGRLFPFEELTDRAESLLQA